MTIKMRKPETTTKIDKKAFLGGTLFHKNAIFGRFWGPGGDPKIAKNLRGILSKGVLGAIW